jgi:hypothetical protein
LKGRISARPASYTVGDLTGMKSDRKVSTAAFILQLKHSGGSYLLYFTVNSP